MVILVIIDDYDHEHDVFFNSLRLDVTIRVGSVRGATLSDLVCKMPKTKTAYPSVDELSSEFPADSFKRDPEIDRSHKS